jgi:hypothetical protein
MANPSVRIRRRRLAGGAAFLSFALAASSADALIPIPVGGHPKELDVFARLTLERGLVEPNENKASWQKANWEMFTVGGGYGVGDLGPLQDFSIRAEFTGYQSPAEVNDVGKGAVAPGACHGVVIGPGQCQFHPSDKGSFFTPSIGFNLVHTGSFSFGVFLLGNIPIGVDYSKFVLPRSALARRLPNPTKRHAGATRPSGAPCARSTRPPRRYRHLDGAHDLPSRAVLERASASARRSARQCPGGTQRGDKLVRVVVLLVVAALVVKITLDLLRG